MTEDELEQKRAEFMAKCNAPHPDGWLGAMRDREQERWAIYEAWLDSLNRRPVAEFFSRVKSVILGLYQWFLQRIRSE